MKFTTIINTVILLQDAKRNFVFANEKDFKWFILLAQFDIYQMLIFTYFIVRNSGCKY